jgi:hypothetical protein
LDIVLDVTMDVPADSIRVVGQADLLQLARVARSTWNHWIKEGVVGESGRQLYDEAEVVEAVVVGLLVDALDPRRAKAAWLAAREEVVSACLALPLDEPADLTAVIDLHEWRLTLARGPDELHGAVRAPAPFPRGRVAIALADVAQEARRGFWTRAQPAAELSKDKRRKRASRRRNPATGA